MVLSGTPKEVKHMGTPVFIITTESESAQGVLVERRAAASACVYENRRQRTKSLKMVVETSDRKRFFLSLIHF